MTAPIRIVLDHTTIAAYTAGTIAVGEIIAEVWEEGAHIGLPVCCIAMAYLRLPEDQLPGVELLTTHPGTVVVDIDAGDWLAVAGLARDLGHVGAAAALLLAVDADGYVLTAAPDAYGDWKDLPVIPI